MTNLEAMPCWNLRALLGSIVVLTLTVGCGMSESTRESWTARLDDADRVLNARNEAFWTEARPIVEENVRPERRGVCPHEPPPTTGFLGNHVLLLQDAPDLPRVREAREELMSARYGLTANTPVEPNPTEQSLMQDVARDEWWTGADTVLVVRRYVEPEVVSADSFRGGELEGWMLTWSYEEGRIVCVAPVRQESANVVYGHNTVHARDALWKAAMEHGAQALFGI